MCGIAGFAARSRPLPAARKAIEGMCASLAHRGPDDSGALIDGAGGTVLALGQVRLSIVDLTDAGHQPMRYARAVGASSDVHRPDAAWDYAITFNGEVYNFQELRAELSAAGYVFSTGTDTEVILAAYAAWGPGCVNRFNGMWAFALYDRAKNLLFCSRDRFGKKPFYYAMAEGVFAFGSELRALLSHGGFDLSLDPEALDLYFAAGHIPAPRTAYRGIRKLPARHNLFVDLADLSVRTEEYYRLPPYAPSGKRADLAREAGEIFRDAVRVRMFADVPVGAFLSGGLDSSSVVAEMTKFVDRGLLHTFSIGFEGALDETAYVDVVRKAFGTLHHHEYFRELDFTALEADFAEIYDEPLGDFSCFPTTFVSRIARASVAVALSGDGGDEVYGGYATHIIAAQMAALRRLPRWLRSFLLAVMPRPEGLGTVARIREALRVSLLPPQDFYAEIASGAFYKPQAYRDWSRGKLAECLAGAGGDFAQAMIDYDLLHNTLPDNFLVKTDRASMSVALEIRSPFLDYRLVEHARKIPSRWKAGLRRGKILMRDMIRGLVPDVIRLRGKQGFEPPVKEWMARDPEYAKALSAGFEKLRADGALSPGWADFYGRAALPSRLPEYAPHKVRLYLFWLWYRRWVLAA